MARGYKQKSIMAQSVTKTQGNEASFVPKGKQPIAEKATSVMPLDTPPRNMEGILMANTVLKPPKTETYPVGLDVGKSLDTNVIKKNLKKSSKSKK